MENRKEGLGNFNIFKDHFLIESLFSFLETEELFALELTSHYFYFLVQHEEVWKERYLKFFHEKEEELKQRRKFSTSFSLLFPFSTPSTPLFSSSFPFQFHISWKLSFKALQNEKKLLKPLYSSLWFQFINARKLLLEEINFKINYFKFKKEEKQFIRTIPSQSISEITSEIFTKDFDLPANPVVLVNATQDWKANKLWNPHYFLQNFGNQPISIVPKHKKWVMQIQDYFNYCNQQIDIIPLYAFIVDFDSSFHNLKSLLSDYKVPSFFQIDYMDVLGPQKPDYRWIILGPIRSGSLWHKDPNSTSAWNALLYGRKRWALYPPHRIPPAVTFNISLESNEKEVKTPNPIEWFSSIYPTLTDEEMPLEHIQQTGEIMVTKYK